MEVLEKRAIIVLSENFQLESHQSSKQIKENKQRPALPFEQGCILHQIFLIFSSLITLTSDQSHCPFPRVEQR